MLIETHAHEMMFFINIQASNGALGFRIAAFFEQNLQVKKKSP
jgi:hypothetical protein